MKLNKLWINTESDILIQSRSASLSKTQFSWRTDDEEKTLELIKFVEESENIPTI